MTGSSPPAPSHFVNASAITRRVRGGHLFVFAVRSASAYSSYVTRALM